MSKTIRISDKNYKRISRLGFVDQTFDIILDDILDYVYAHKNDFVEFQDELYEEEE